MRTLTQALRATLIVAQLALIFLLASPARANNNDVSDYIRRQSNCARSSKADPINVFFSINATSTNVYNHWMHAVGWNWWEGTTIMYINHHAPCVRHDWGARSTVFPTEGNHIRQWYGDYDPAWGTFTVAAAHKDIGCPIEHKSTSYNDVRDEIGQLFRNEGHNAYLLVAGKYSGELAV